MHGLPNGPLAPIEPAGIISLACRLPCLVLHGGDDLNMPAHNALRLPGPPVLGNDDEQQAVFPGSTTTFLSDPLSGCGEQNDLQASPTNDLGGLDVIVGWAVWVLRAKR